MATGSNTSFYYEEAPASALSRHSISFSSSAVNSTWDMIPMGYQYGGMNGSPGMIVPTSSNSTVLSDSRLSQAGTSSGSLGPDTLGLKHDTGLAVEWSVEEQYTLEKSLDIYKNEPSIMRYIKIAATLPDKTVRDVALRCRWMARKRRKQEEHYSGKKITNRKDKLVESCPNPSLSSAQHFNMLTHSPMMHEFGQSGLAQSEASCDTVKHFLQQNLDAFDQISANLSTYKFQENIELFFRARNNITAVLNEMRQLPGLPNFPISINEDLMNCLLPDINQHLQTPMGWGNGVHLKQEPRS
uniref:Uncharacterized protein n=1 Tax=Kalanchoe fedtschenkoi TaxID=63787 RepID=A0A7N0UMR0_KALFE